MIIAPLVARWNNSRDLLKLECDLALGWEEFPKRNKFNWRSEEKLPSIPPSWGEGAPSGKVEVWLEGFSDAWENVAKGLLGSFEYTASPPIVRRLECQCRPSDSHVLLKVDVEVAEGGKKGRWWSRTTTTQVEKDKLEIWISVRASTGCGSGKVNVRIVVKPPELKPGPIGRQGTGSPKIVGGGLPS